MMPEATEGMDPEKKLRLATELLSQCPPGEFADVLQDIQAILANDQLLAQLHETVKRRNLESGATVNVNMDNGEEMKLILHDANELEDGKFMDPESGTIITVNHFNLVVAWILLFIHHIQEVENVAIDEEKKCEDELRLEMKRAVMEYTKQALPRGRNLVYKQISSQKYFIVMVDGRFQLENMRNGQWYSSWEIDISAKRAIGKISVIVHYFEDGNVQLNTSKECQFDWDLDNYKGDWATAGRELLKMIRTKEDDVQVAVNEAYSQLAETTFKKLRRQLPVTRSKVDWGKLSSYKVGDQLK